MTDSARAYFDSFLGMAGEPGRRAREFAGKVREDLRSGSEQMREHGTRTASDLGRLIRSEVDAGLTRLGVATHADLDDLNLRLEHSEEQIRDLRIRLAEAEARANAAEKSPGRPAPAETPSSASAATMEPIDDEEEDA
ncbi:phasin family protein [Glycomyces tritici]|uniref:Phasin family protein n=1 Tax=Glycomyces tritici TaxID=2665176 RepID=A0ABT7YRU1_9ACTN|nr:phasin family protein [Glycomyces tritici]MDN3241359.1 phasin family protein [Glycomyces tritici]MDN3242157.1 phasin family protein [Glycomyces tritici]